MSINAAPQWQPGDATLLINFHKQAELSKKLINAHQRSCMWLAAANEAEEAGMAAKAEKCMSKAQYWLDRLTKLEGRA